MSGGNYAPPILYTGERETGKIAREFNVQKVN